MSEGFRKCLKQERDRARSRRESAQGKFEASLQSFDQFLDTFEDPSKAAVFSDGSADAERVYSYDESVDDSYYTRRIKVARRRLFRHDKRLVETLNLILQNGKNRRESIAVLAARHRLDRDAASTLYWRHLKKISLFFKAQ